MTPADRLLLMDILFGITVSVTADGAHLRLVGPPLALEAAAPSVRLHKSELLEFLRAQGNPTAAR